MSVLNTLNIFTDLKGPNKNIKTEKSYFDKKPSVSTDQDGQSIQNHSKILLNVDVDIDLSCSQHDQNE